MPSASGQYDCPRTNKCANIKSFLKTYSNILSVICIYKKFLKWIHTFIILQICFKFLLRLVLILAFALKCTHQRHTLLFFCLSLLKIVSELVFTDVGFNRNDIFCYFFLSYQVIETVLLIFSNWFQLNKYCYKLVYVFISCCVVCWCSDMLILFIEILSFCSRGHITLPLIMQVYTSRK